MAYWVLKAILTPILRVLFERRVHRFISKDNDRLVRTAIERGVRKRDRL